MKIIDEIFFGELTPNGNFPTNSDYDKAVKIILENEEILLRNLNGTDKTLFIQYTNAHSSASGTEALGYFTLGFKMGAKLMQEINDEQEESHG